MLLDIQDIAIILFFVQYNKLYLSICPPSTTGQDHAGRRPLIPGPLPGINRDTGAPEHLCCRTVSELVAARYGVMDHEAMAARLNRSMHGLANYFVLGQVSPAYRAIDQHASRRLRQWLCRKHKVRSGIFVRFPDKRLWDDMGLTRLALRTASLPWAKA